MLSTDKNSKANMQKCRVPWSTASQDAHHAGRWRLKPGLRGLCGVGVQGWPLQRVKEWTSKAGQQCGMHQQRALQAQHCCGISGAAAQACWHQLNHSLQGSL